MTDTKALIAEAQVHIIRAETHTHSTMGDTKALIAEAQVRIIRAETHTHSTMGDTDLIRRLAAALEEATPPEGWVISAYERQDAVCVEYDGVAHWLITDATGTRTMPAYPTARAAMEALEKGEISP